ncbi:UTP--glucose-1-phosphate uridylyltransferase [bacterium]|nr:MAG: UTP--glucose-1-phosphate uridylyltransferase [bacterium]
MNKIRKAVIPAAGLGTRFLPQTKASPKEMMPVIDKPIIQYVVEEIVSSGIEDIVIVTGANKRAIEDHFDAPSQELVNLLISSHKFDHLDNVTRIAELANFIYIRQKGKYGNGTPVLNAEHVIGNEPFAVLWGDEFIYSKPPRLAQMINVYEKYGGIIISGVEILEKENLRKYGIAEVRNLESNIYEILNIIEKPDPNLAPSNIATHGAYILPPEIFEALRDIAPGKGDEVWLVDAINLLHKKGVPLYTVVIENGKYFDTGDKFEYLKTITEFGLNNPEFGDMYREFLSKLIENF